MENGVLDVINCGLIRASAFVGLGAGLWVGLCCMGVLLLGFCFLSGFSECGGYVPALLTCSVICLQRMPASVRSWHAVKSLGRKVRSEGLRDP